MSAGAVLAALCISSGALHASVPTAAFDLQWMHSIEKTEWLEHWEVTPQLLTLVRASIATSGAGMDIPDNAVLVNGRYEYPVNVQLNSVTLSHSPYTAQATLCMNNTCKPLADWLPGLPAIAAIDLTPCQPSNN